MKLAVVLIAAVLPAALVAQQFDPTKAPTRPVGTADPRTFPNLPGSDQPVKLRVGPGGKDSFPGPISGMNVTVDAGKPIILAYYRDDVTKPIKTNVRLESSDDAAFTKVKGSALALPNSYGTITLDTVAKPYGFESNGTHTLYLRVKTGSVPSNTVAVTTNGAAVIQ